MRVFYYDLIRSFVEIFAVFFFFFVKCVACYAILELEKFGPMVYFGVNASYKAEISDGEKS